ncbi:AraC family transcriptional regulator [Lachnospiraceae bacterium ZAX-1]
MRENAIKVLRGQMVKTGIPHIGFVAYGSANMDAYVNHALAEGVVHQLSFADKFSIENMNCQFLHLACIPYHIKERFIELLSFDSISGVNKEHGLGDFEITGGIYISLNQGKAGELIFSPDVPIKGIRILIREEFYQSYLKTRFPKDSLATDDIALLNNVNCTNPGLQLIFGQIKRSIESGVDSELYYESKIAEILYFITAQNTDCPLRKMCEQRILSQTDMTAVNRVKEMIHERISDSIKISELVFITGTSAAKLQNDFKTAFGSTIHKYLQSRRMDIALLEIENTDKPLQIIAQEIGIKKPSHFSEIFKRTYGMTPMEYRSIARQQEVGVNG